VMCAATGRSYSIYGYKGKQVRDQIHSSDVASLFLHFFHHPRPGEVYNLGGGRNNSISVLETIQILDDLGFPLKYELKEHNRIGDHICYISDLTKLRAHFPQWQPKYDIPCMIEDLIRRYVTSTRA